MKTRQRLKKAFSVLLALVLLCGTGTTAHASARSVFDYNAAQLTHIFEQRRTAPTWLFTDLLKLPGHSVTLKCEEYGVTFYSETIGEVDEKLERYDLMITRQLDKLDAYHYAVGERTPKYVLNVRHEGALPGDMTVTYYDSSFAPYSTLTVYRVLGNQQYEPIEREVLVDNGSNFSFTITQGGDYLVTSRSIAERINDVFEQDYPQRTPTEELLTFLTEESRYDFSDLITRRSVGE